MSDEQASQVEEVAEPQTEEPNRAEARIKELLAAKSEAETVAAEEARARAVAEARYQEAVRLQSQAPAPEPPEDEWADPAEKQARAALKAAEEAKRLAQDSAESTRRQMTAMSIDKAVLAHDDWLNVKSVKNRLAERYFLANANGSAFDAEAEVAALHKEEQDALASRQEAWAKTKAQQAVATASATHSPSPPTSPATERAPAWGTPERAEWDDKLTKEIFAEHGF